MIIKFCKALAANFGERDENQFILNRSRILLITVNAYYRGSIIQSLPDIVTRCLPL